MILIVQNLSAGVKYRQRRILQCIAAFTATACQNRDECAACKL